MANYNIYDENGRYAGRASDGRISTFPGDVPWWVTLILLLPGLILIGIITLLVIAIIISSFFI